jgi:hypothetical protein
MMTTDADKRRGGVFSEKVRKDADIEEDREHGSDQSIPRETYRRSESFHPLAAKFRSSIQRPLAYLP